MTLSGLKIGHKLIGTFGIVLACLVFLGGFGVYQIKRINEATIVIGSNVEALTQLSTSRATLFQAQALLQTSVQQPGPGRAARLSEVSDKAKVSQTNWKLYAAACEPGAECDAAAKIDALWATYVDNLKGMQTSSTGEFDPAVLAATLKTGSAIVDAMQADFDYEGHQSNDAVTSAAATAAQSSLIMIVTLVVAASVSSALCWLVLRNITGPIKDLTSIMGRLAGNKTDVMVPGLDRKDELGAMAQSVEVFKNGIDARAALEVSAAEAGRVAEAERSHNEAQRAEAAKQQAKVVGDLATGLSKLASGDLVQRLEQPFEAEYEALRTDFNAALSQLQTTMRDVSTNTSAIRSGTGEISTASDDLSRRTEQQAASLEETAAALDEITATVKKTAEGATHAQQVVSNAKSDAEHSGQIVRQAVTAMTAIEASSRKVSQIIGVIDEIAFQTNLLALNAGVEAARAGEAGRGFAVVASEVRGLAQRSAEAAKEIKALILASTQQVEEGVELVGDTGKALDRIVAQVSEINDIVSGMAATAQEQSTALQEVNTAINQMDQVTQQNAAMVEETAAASHGLVRETEELILLIGRFQVGRVSLAPPSHEQARATTKPASKPSRKPGAPVAALRTVGRGGAAPNPAAAEEGWTEF